MIYRIHHDENYLMHVIPPSESVKKLGNNYGTFAFDSSPKVYAQAWVELEIEFDKCQGSKATEIPDVSENFGRLFLSTRAKDALGNLLEKDGEFLPVNYSSGNGFIFNPLITAEPLNAVDNKLTAEDQYGNLINYGFIEQRIKNHSIFRTELDTYKGIFCSESVVEAYQSAGLTGVKFSADVSNPIGESFGTTQ